MLTSKQNLPYAEYKLDSEFYALQHNLQVKSNLFKVYAIHS